MREETKRWLDYAKQDLISAKINFKSKVYYVSSFLCQQAAEKALKAVLVEKDQLLKIHDITSLAEQVKLPVDLKEKCGDLTTAYVTTRYPDSSNVRSAFDLKTADRLIQIAAAILIWSEKELSTS